MMPSLREILNDPNYINANPATKEAIFNKYAPEDKNYVEANEATQQAIRQRFGLVQPETEVTAPTSAAPISPEEQPDDPNRSVLADWTKFGGAIGTRMLSSVPEGAIDVATGLARPALTGEYMERGPIGAQLFNKAIALVRDAFGTSLEKQEQEKLATKIAADKSITEVKDLFELPRFFEYLSETGKEVSKNLIESTSPQFQRKLKGAEPKGNILKAIKEGDFSEISFGDNPTIEGYLANTAQGLGSVAPVIATYLITKSPGAAGAVGAGLTAGEASNTAKDYIKSKRRRKAEIALFMS